MARLTTAHRFLCISKVLDRVGVSRPTIYRWVAAGEFPKKSPSLRTLSFGWCPTSPSGWINASGRDELLSSRLSGDHVMCGGGAREILIFTSKLSQAESCQCISDHSE